MPWRSRLMNTAATRGRSRGHGRFPSRRSRPGSRPGPWSRTAGRLARRPTACRAAGVAVVHHPLQHRRAVLAALDLVGLGQDQSPPAGSGRVPVGPSRASGYRPPSSEVRPSAMVTLVADDLAVADLAQHLAERRPGRRTRIRRPSACARAGGLGGGQNKARTSGSPPPVPGSRRSRAGWRRDAGRRW